MALFNENSGGMYMPVAPAYSNANGGGFGWGGDWAWILLLLLIGGNGWGMGGFGGGMWPMMMGGMAGGWGMDYLYPWLNNSEHISDGFRDQQLNTQVQGIQNAVTTGFGDVQNSLCAGFAGVNAGISNAAAQAEISANARQMANMQQLFGVQSALQNCCCENRANIADLKYTVATENCADRAAAATNTRDIIDAQTRGTQAILDKLCALELDNVKAQLAQAQRENVGLQNAVNMANMQASQTAQTAQILAGQAAEIDGVYNRLKNCPVGTYPVCNPLSSPGFGCGCGAA